MKNVYYVECLANNFERLRSTNPAFSLRSYSKYLKVPASILSDVLKEKRILPKKHLEYIFSQLKLNKKSIKLFMESYELANKNLKNIANIKEAAEHELDSEYDFQIIEQWEYYAIFTLISNAEFKAEASWIANRLNISIESANKIFNELEKEKLIGKNEEGKYIKLVEALTSSKEIPSKVIRNNHLKFLDMAKEKIETVEIENRLFLNSTFALNSAHIQDVKRITREFFKKLSTFLHEETSQSNNVFRIGVQLFPLTQMDSRDE